MKKIKTIKKKIDTTVKEITPQEQEFANRIKQIENTLKELNIKIICKQVLRNNGVIELELWYVDTKSTQ